jgi:3'-phosphoadenosine 5'-phosphosulfate sulfotransferase (PAPS reductase)/FAD synthetase
MGRAHSGRENQLTLLPADPHSIIREAWEQHGEHIVRRTAMLSGGNDSATLAHWLAWHGYIDELLFLNTGIGIAETRRFVHRFAKHLGLPLQEWHAPPGAYQTMIITISGGFPGPAMHSLAYQRLKERPLGDYLAYRKRGAHWRSKVLLFSGIRRSESAKRMLIAEKPVDPDGGKLWVAPYIDWTRADLGTWREEHDIPHNDVADLLHYSGECLCGANASEGELEFIERFFPDAAREIHRLQRLADRLGIERSRWGERWHEKSSATGPACGDCQMRFAAMAECEVPILRAKRHVTVHTYGQPRPVTITARIHTPGREPGPVAHELHQVPFVELGASGLHLGETRVGWFEQGENSKLLLGKPNGPPGPGRDLLEAHHGERQTALDLTCRCECKRIRGRLPASCTHQPGLAVWMLSEPFVPLSTGSSHARQSLLARLGVIDDMRFTRGPIRVTNANGRTVFDRLRVIDRLLLLQDTISARLLLHGDDPEGPLGQIGAWNVPGMGLFRSILIGRDKDASAIEQVWRDMGIEPGYRMPSVNPDYYEAVTVAPRYPGDPEEPQLLNALPADLWTPEDPTPERAWETPPKPQMLTPSTINPKGT